MTVFPAYLLYCALSGLLLGAPPAPVASADAAPSGGRVAGLVLPHVESARILDDWRAQAVAEGVAPDAVELACRPFAESLLLCFDLWEGDERRYVNRADLAAWAVDLPTLERQARKAELEGFSASKLEKIQVVGDVRSYWMATDTERREQAALFAPEILAQVVGGTPVVAIPVRGVLLAMPLGDRELEQIVAVGARKAWDTMPDPITPVLYAWRDGSWVARSEAVRGDDRR
jgi:hypothetical protein